MTITDHTTVAEIAATIPSSVRIFQQHGIDFCCGGRKPLRTACEEQGVPLAELTRAIEAAATAPTAERDWTHEPLGALVTHIVTTYHDSLRTELPRLQSMALKVLQVHGAKAPHLARLNELVIAFSEDMFAHMHKEEMVLFPSIREIEHGDAGQPAWIEMPIGVMVQEHDSAAAQLAEMRRITDDYVAPEWACQTFRALYHGLEEVEQATHVHVHLENNVLFPRAIERARRTAAVTA